MPDRNTPNPSQKRYPPELRERAVRMVVETIEQTGTRTSVITRIARQLGIGPESLRTWVRQAEVDAGALFAGFVMLTDPPTSPGRHAQQYTYGVVAAAVSVVGVVLGQVDALLLGLLAANAWLAVQRHRR